MPIFIISSERSEGSFKATETEAGEISKASAFRLELFSDFVAFGFSVVVLASVAIALVGIDVGIEAERMFVTEGSSVSKSNWSSPDATERVSSDEECSDVAVVAVDGSKDDSSGVESLLQDKEGDVVSTLDLAVSGWFNRWGSGSGVIAIDAAVIGVVGVFEAIGGDVDGTDGNAFAVVEAASDALVKTEPVSEANPNASSTLTFAWSSAASTSGAEAIADATVKFPDCTTARTTYCP